MSGFCMDKVKNAVLTGASKGIGKKILEKLTLEKINVWCLCRTWSEEFSEYIEKLEKENGVWIKHVFCDLSSEDSIRTAASTVLLDKNAIDYLINCAGINYRNSFLMTSAEDMKNVFQVNYYSPIRLIQLLSKNMIRNGGGKIINISSASGFEHNVGTFAYGASKNALNWATETMSRELAPFGIVVNGVAPGITDTDINKGNEVEIEKVISNMNIHRKANPDEIANIVMFLLSDKASYISGHIIRVDGGRVK